MRNRMADGYFNINVDIVWDTIHDSLPNLDERIARITASFSPESRSPG